MGNIKDNVVAKVEEVKKEVNDKVSDLKKGKEDEKK